MAKLLGANTATFYLGGEDAGIIPAFKLFVDAASFAASEQSNAFVESELLVADAGTFTVITGVAVITPVIMLPAVIGNFYFYWSNRRDRAV